MVVLHHVLQVFESGPEVGEVGSFPPELFVAQSLERQHRFESGNEIGPKLFVESVARGADSLIEFFRRAFLFFDGGGALSCFHIAGGSIGFITDAARFLKFEKVQLVLGERKPAHSNSELGTDPSERCGAELQIVFIDFRVERVPKRFHESTKQVKAFAKTRDVIAEQNGFGQPSANLQILGFSGKRLGGQLDNEGVIGLLYFAGPVSLRKNVFFAARFANLIVDGVVTKTLSAGVITRNGVEQTIGQGHGRQEAVWTIVICTLRRSRSGHSSSSASNIFWPTGKTSPSAVSSQSVARPKRTAVSGCCAANGVKTGRRTSPSSRSWYLSEVRTFAGSQRRSRRRLGGSMSIEVSSANGIHI